MRSKPKNSAVVEGPSAGPFFWVFGPLLIICIAMFIANPQCILNLDMSCSQNWKFENGLIWYWEPNESWLRLAGLTAGLTLLVVWLTMIYQLVLVAAGKRAKDRYTVMGLFISCLIPGALLLIYQQLQRDNDLSLIDASTDNRGFQYSLLEYNDGSNHRFLVGQIEAKDRLTTKIRVLGLVDTKTRPRSSLVLIPDANRAQKLNLNSSAQLFFIRASNWLVLIYGRYNLLLAFDTQSRMLVPESELNSISPFLFLTRLDDINPKDRHRLLSLLSMTKSTPSERQKFGLPDYRLVVEETRNEVDQVRALSAEMLSFYPEHSSEALSVLFSLQQNDPSPLVRANAEMSLKKLSSEEGELEIDPLPEERAPDTRATQAPSALLPRPSSQPPAIPPRRSID